MIQEASQGTVDLRYWEPELSPSERLYILFLLFVCILTFVQLFRAWRTAPPFRLSKQVSNSSYIKMLEVSSTRLKHWILCTLLACGLLTSLRLYDVCGRLVGKTIPSTLIPIVLRLYATELTMTVLVIFFVFVVRWHFLIRIGGLRE